MAIENNDLQIIINLRDRNPHGSTCAILGDCNIHGHSLESFAKLMRFEEVHTFDVNGDPTYKLNLNEPIPKEIEDKYDWVIDSGTLYCCFDPSTVFKNITNMLKDKGTVIHTGNLSGFYGRGFYSLSPALFRDFYKANDFKILCMATKTRQGNWNINNAEHTYLSPASSPQNMIFQQDSGPYMAYIPNDSMMLCCASRVQKKTFTKPVPEHFIKTDGK